MYPIIKIKETKEKFRHRTIPVIYSNQNCKCFYCGKFLQFKKFHPENADRKDGYTIDHLFPRMLGFTLYGNDFTCIVHEQETDILNLFKQMLDNSSN